MKIKLQLNNALTFMILIIITQFSLANKTKTVSKEKPVVLEKNEYLIQYSKVKDVRFKTKDFENLELSENCFKNTKPKCTAFEKSLLGTKENHSDHMIGPGHNNWGAIHCALIGGESLIVKTSSGNESDFCQFKDGSLVSSWSSYYKQTRK